MMGLDRRSFDEAIDDLLRPESIESSRQLPDEATGYVAWGEYGRILAGYFDVFPREQILVVFTNELEGSPDQLMRRVQGFIGVNPDSLPDNLGKRYRMGGTERRFPWMSPDAMQRAVAQSSVTRGLWHLLPKDGRRRIDHIFRHTAYLVDLWNRRNGQSIVDTSDYTRNRLYEHFVQDAAQLSEILR